MPRLLPVYIAVDVSLSMEGEPMQTVNSIIPTICDILREKPTLRDLVRFSLVEFASTASVRVPLSSLREVEYPLLEPQLATSYAAVFRLLRSQILADNQLLRADHFELYRPVVFFLTDGEPTETEEVWHRELDLLCGREAIEEGQPNRFWPNLIPFGIGEANPETLRVIAHPAHKVTPFVTAEGHTAKQAIEAMVEKLIESVITSTGQPQFTELSSDAHDDEQLGPVDIFQLPVDQDESAVVPVGADGINDTSHSDQTDRDTETDTDWDDASLVVGREELG